MSEKPESIVVTDQPMAWDRWIQDVNNLLALRDMGDQYEDSEWRHFFDEGYSPRCAVDEATEGS